jgi:hypothetical protein
VTESCRRGHPYIEGNFRMHYDGSRLCLICKKARDKQYKAKDYVKPPEGSGLAATVVRCLQAGMDNPQQISDHIGSHGKRSVAASLVLLKSKGVVDCIKVGKVWKWSAKVGAPKEPLEECWPHLITIPQGKVSVTHREHV